MSGWHVSDAPASELGESPFWHPRERMLYWVDIVGRRIHRCDAAGAGFEGWDMPQEPGCIAPAPGSGLVIALRDGMYRAREWGGALELLHRFGHDTATVRFNDGKCDPLGRFWAGTMHEPRNMRVAGLYALDARGGKNPRVQTMVDRVLLANGLAWSPDAKTVYFADTMDHNIRAWDWDGESNTMAHPRQFQQFAPRPQGWQPGAPGAEKTYGGRPDGAEVDSAGNYWCAMFEGKRLLKFSPAGQLLDEIPSPVQCPTMPCFGGDDLRTLFITSARWHRGASELAALPDSGRVFSMRVDVPGRPVNFFAG